MPTRRIYLDYASTTPVDPRIFEAMQPYFMDKFGNASSVHSYGRETKVALESARESIAKLFNAHPSEIVFTSGGTEAINYAIKGAMLQQLIRGKNHIITSKAEHQAVLKCCEYLEENGFHVSYLDVDSNGCVDTQALRESITSQTGLVAIIHANNEIGSLNAIREIGEITREREIAFLSDTTQSYGKIILDHQKEKFDLAVASAHKIYGPKGVGALFIRRGVELDQLLHGGPQERERRGGTENVPLAVGFGKAAEIALHERETWKNLFAQLKNYFIEKLEEMSHHIRINGNTEHSLPNILSVSFPSDHFDLEGETLLMNMDLNGIAVSSGSACTSGSIEPSHVMLAMGYDRKTADATLRFSFGKDTTIEEVQYACEVLRNIVTRNEKK